MGFVKDRFIYLLDVADVLMALNINIYFEHYKTTFLFLVLHIFIT